MKRRHAWWMILPLIFFCLATGATAGGAAEGEENPGLLTGAIGFAGLYDSNLDPAWILPLRDDAEGDFVYQLDAKLGLSLAFPSNWRMELDLQNLADWPLKYTDNSWFVENAGLYVGTSFGANTVSMLNSLRYFSSANNNVVDLLRNGVTVTGKRVFSRWWEGLIGYENFLNHHPEDSHLDYVMNGGFIEIRNPWTPLASTNYSFDYLYYQGADQAPEISLVGPPADGYRCSGEIGFDAIFALRHSLQGSYSYQFDRGTYEKAEAPDAQRYAPAPDGGSHGGQPDGPQPPPMPIDQVHGFEGEQTSLEVDAEFNYAKHKASLLYSLRFNDRFSTSLYHEYIYKDFLATENAPMGITGDRIDRLFLASVWFTARLQDQLFAKTYYVFRINLPTDDSENIEEHIVSMGVECRF